MNYGRVFCEKVRLLQDSLNLTSFFQRLISHDLPDINSPGYGSRELSFEQALRECFEEERGNGLIRTDQGHLDSSDAVQAMNSTSSEETMSVDLESEMMKLARNSIEYQFITTMLHKRFALFRQAIEEGSQ
jgi:flagellar basal-body rod protein FlgB